MIKKIKEYDNIVDELAQIFVEKYFFKDYIFDDDYYWVGTQDEDREVLAVGDYFFSIDRIIDAIRYNASKKRLFDFYDLELDWHTKNQEPTVNFRNYIKNGNKPK